MLKDYRAKWAIVIGVNGYRPGSGLAPLNFALNDARAVGNALVKDYGFILVRPGGASGGEDGLSLSAAAATKAGMESLLKEEVRRRATHEHDCVLVFFAGHGLVDWESPRWDGYLAVADSDKDRLRDTCVSVADVVAWLDCLPCRHKLVVLDCCYSGALFRRAEPAPPARDDQPDRTGQPPKLLPDVTVRSRGGPAGLPSRGDNLAYYLGRPAFFGLSAGRDTPVTDGADQDQHSLFTKTFLEVLREQGNSAREDHAFTFRTLAAQVEARVSYALDSYQVPDWGRVGRVGGDAGDFVFRPVVRRPTPRQLADAARHASLLTQAETVWAARRPDPADALLERCDRAQRAWEWNYLKRLVRGGLRSTADVEDEETRCVAYSPSGRLVVSGGKYSSARNAGLRPGGRDGTLRVYDTATGRLVRTAGEKFRDVTGVACCSDTRVVFGNGDGTVMVWDVGDKPPVMLHKHAGPVRSLAYHAGSRLVATAGQDKRIVLANEATGQEVRVIAAADTVGGLAFGPDGAWLAVAVGKHVELREVRTGEPLKPMHGPEHAAWVTGVAVRPDGREFASGDVRGVVKRWDVVTGQVLRTFQAHTWPINALGYSPDGATLATACSDGTINAWDVESGILRYTLCGRVGEPGGLAFSPDGRVLASANARRILHGLTVAVYLEFAGTVTFWDARLPPGLRHALGPEQGQLTPHALWFSPDSSRVFCKGLVTEDDRGVGKGLVMHWDATKGTALVPVPRVQAGTITPDGQLVLVMGEDAVRLHDAVDGKELRRIERPPAQTRTVAVSPDGKTVATAGYDRLVHVWDMNSGKDVHPPYRLRDFATALAFSPDGVHLAVGLGAGLLGQHREVVVFGTGNAKPVLTLHGHEGYIHDVAFSPGGRFLASAGSDGTARLWDVATGQGVLTLYSQSGGINGVTFSPDGRRLATAEWHGVRIWSADTGQELLTLRGHTRSVQAVAFSSDGRLLASAGSDGRLLIWDATPLGSTVNLVPAKR